MSEEPAPPSGRGRAHDLSRRRRTRAVRVETGRQHHMGGPPPAAPVHGADGTVDWTEAAPHRVRQLQDGPLADLVADLAVRMRAAAEATDFEAAAALRDRWEVARAEQDRRAAPDVSG